MPKSKKEVSRNIKSKKGRGKEKANSFSTPKGMHDILPQDQIWWDKLINAGQELAELYDFYRIETPILESAGVFERSLGEATDVLEKQMYILKTKGGDKLALRPEATAPIMRSYIQHHLGYWAQPLRVYYFGPMFRHEHAQAGRYRQFHQFGFETIGDADAVYDVQLILMMRHFLELLKISDIKLQVNTIGCRVCRPHYQRKLQDYYKPLKKKICKDCQRRLEVNPLRLLDCKNEVCQEFKQNAPSLLNNLCQNCNSHFREVLELLENSEVPYEPNPFLVRGLDYYNRTIFEIFSGENNLALAAGGRYDYLAELLGGRLVPAVGGALGMERVIEIIKSGNNSAKVPTKVFFIAIGDQAKKAALPYMIKLRKAGVRVAESLGKDSLKSQLGAADRQKAKLALIFGQKEVFEESIIIRDMKNGAQETVSLSKIVEEVKKRLR